MYIKIVNDKIIDITNEQLDTYIYVPDHLSIGIDWTVSSWNGDIPTTFISPPEPPSEYQIYNYKSEEVRQKRDFLLQETDWIVIRAVDTNIEIPNEWKIYRQSLRDITQHPNFPNIEEGDWPIKPT